MPYVLDGIATFAFEGVEIEGYDPQGAVHEVETMGVRELLEYAMDALEVKVVKMTILPDGREP